MYNLKYIFKKMKEWMIKDINPKQLKKKLD